MRAILFDLDGTLVDSLADIGHAVNHALEAEGLPVHSLDDYRRMVGEGAAELVRRALPQSHAGRHAEVLAAFRARYRRTLAVHTRPYDGIAEVLAALERREVPKAILTNKPEEPAIELVTQILGGYRWHAVVGQREGQPKKPDPSAALALAASIGAAPADCVFVGDSGVDVETARRAGMQAVGCLWGFRERAELEAAGAHHLVDHPRALLALLSSALG